MSGRSLAYLTSRSTDEVKGIGPAIAKRLAAAGVGSVTDLLLHVPRRYLDRSALFDIAAVPLGEEVTVGGVIETISSRRIRGNRTLIEATVSDGTSRVRVIWFNPYLKLEQGAEVALSGKVELNRGFLEMKSPDVDRLDRPDEDLVTGRVLPVYPTPAGIRPARLRQAVDNALRRSRPITEVLPAAMLARHRLLSRDEAMAAVHNPQELAQVAPGRRRLVFDELFRLEVALAMRKRRQIDDATGVAHTVDGLLVTPFLEALPFPLTGAQRRAIDEITADLASPHPMHRLLQGEVGSGKTVVAFAALLTAVQGGLQGAVMAPTEVLAAQHYLVMSDMIVEAGMEPTVIDRSVPDGQRDLFTNDDATQPAAAGRSVRMALLTGKQAAANFSARSVRPADITRWIADGTVDIVVGTHALIQEGVDFADLGVAVVDEQHRFGVHQRVELREKAATHDPDLLIMTATPIPRTMAMTLYGDLDMSVLDEMPPGRIPVETRLLGTSPADLEAVYRTVRAEIAAGHQAFVVCPLVMESDKTEAASAVAEFERLRGVFPELRLGLIHGQLRTEDKHQAMHAMKDGAVDVLVATTVIEVGIDIPNATLMVIEDADRFGLSQLHQLRGRVGRSGHRSFCLLVAEPTTEEGKQRLEAMLSSTDGFELAEEDLRIRGQGTVFGARQAGIKDLKLADILRDAALLATARQEAFDLVAADPALTAHPEIAEEVRALLGTDVDWLFKS
ncbi:MAG: ATP-dependent DNA helicase RecG [Acidimicrobiia bacterium]|nr:ATP-dependent DNA helicase RecG [Acidimicrobiia bacterium]